MPPTGTGFGSGSTRINRPARRAGTGSLPSRNQRYAVTGCTPYSRAHSLKFTTTYYCLLKGQQLAPPSTSLARRASRPRTTTSSRPRRSSKPDANDLTDEGDAAVRRVAALIKKSEVDAKIEVDGHVARGPGSDRA